MSTLTHPIGRMALRPAPRLVTPLRFESGYAIAAAGIGAADAANGTFHYVGRRFSGGAAMRFLDNRTSSGGARNMIRFDADETLNLAWDRSGGQNDVNINSDSPWEPGKWVTISCSFGDSAGELYINGIEDSAAGNDWGFTTLGWSISDWGLGGRWETGDELVDGEFLLAVWAGVRVDLTAAANLAKFQRGGFPVDIGPDGSYPGIGVPDLYFRGPHKTGDTIVNYGAGPNFTRAGGVIRDGSPIELLAA